MKNKSATPSKPQKQAKKRKKRRLIFWGIVALAAVVVVLSLNRPSDPDTKKGETVKVEFGGILDRLTETGTIELVRSVDVKSKISGKIKEIFVEEGQEVKANQLLAIVEPDPNQTLMLYGKRAAVDRAKIEYVEKEKELKRNQALFEKKLISSQELEKIENLYRLAYNAFKQAELEQEIMEMEMAEASSGSLENMNSDEATQLDDYRIITPISGIVIGREVEVGEMVVTGISSYMVGTTVFQIGDPSEMIVKSSISEIDLGRLRKGQEVRIVPDSYPDELYLGKIKNIAPVGVIKQGASIVTFDVEVEILDPDARLRQGMSCDIDIIFDTRENTLVLPVEAVHEVMVKDTEGEDTSAVDYLVAYKWNEDEFEEVRLEIGLESNNRVEILSGLVLGDEVSLEANQKYKEFRDREKEVKEKSEKVKKQ